MNTSYYHMTSYTDEDYNCRISSFFMNIFACVDSRQIGRQIYICISIYKSLFSSLFLSLYHTEQVILTLYLSIFNCTSQYLSYRISRRVYINQELCILFRGKGQLAFSVIHMIVALCQIMFSITMPCDSSQRKISIMTMLLSLFRD